MRCGRSSCGAAAPPPSDERKKEDSISEYYPVLPEIRITLRDRIDEAESIDAIDARDRSGPKIEIAKEGHAAGGTTGELNWCMVSSGVAVLAARVMGDGIDPPLCGFDASGWSREGR